MKPKIYLAVFEMAPDWWAGDALAEDGTGVAGHVSSDSGYAKHDMGLTSDWQHDKYRAHYPDGYEVEWVDDPSTHPGWQAALELNRQQNPADEAVLA